VEPLNQSAPIPFIWSFCSNFCGKSVPWCVSFTYRSWNVL